MTTIAALHIEGQGTWIASDQMLSGGGIKGKMPSKWIVHPNGFAIATAGAARALNILNQEADRLVGDRPAPHDFILRLRAILEAHGYVSMVESPGPQIWGQHFVLASPSGLWGVDPSLFIQPIPAGKLWAEGSGRDFAFGASFVTDTHEDPLFRVTSAIEAAIQFDESSGVGVFCAHLAPAMLEDAAEPKARVKRVKAKPGKKTSGPRRKRVA